MKSIIAIAALGAALALPTVAAAQEGTVTGAAGGAVTGAIVGGPVGAAIGGIAGATLGTALSPPPPEVRSYVIERPVETVSIDGTVVVGEPLPQVVTLYPVQGYEPYTYANVNGQIVIVDPETRVIVDVVR